VLEIGGGGSFVRGCCAGTLTRAPYGRSEEALMPAISGKRFNWLRSPSAWERNQAWRERQQEARANFEASAADANTKFFGATTNLTQGLASIAAQAASRRMQSQALNSALNKLV
jgi:hypothetical protein